MFNKLSSPQSPLPTNVLRDMMPKSGNVEGFYESLRNLPTDTQAVIEVEAKKNYSISGIPGAYVDLLDREKKGKTTDELHKLELSLAAFIAVQSFLKSFDIFMEVDVDLNCELENIPVAILMFKRPKQEAKYIGIVGSTKFDSISVDHEKTDDRFTITPKYVPCSVTMDLFDARPFNDPEPDLSKLGVSEISEDREALIELTSCRPLPALIVVRSLEEIEKRRVSSRERYLMLGQGALELIQQDN